MWFTVGVDSAHEKGDLKVADCVAALKQHRGHDTPVFEWMRIR